MKQLIYSLLALLYFLPQNIKAEASISASVTETEPRSSWLVTVALSNSAESNYTAFQMNVYLPDGFRYTDGSIAPGQSIPAHMVAAAQHPDGYLRITAYSATNLAIASGEKTLVSFQLTADPATAPSGTHNLVFSHILFSQRNGIEAQLEDIATQLTCSEPQAYRITYMVDGQVYHTTEVKQGSSITPPAAPTKEGHTFKGWDGLPEIMPANDITVTARFAVNNYTASYYLDNELYTTQEVAYGSALTLPEVTPPIGYIFEGWNDIPATMPAHDISIYGTLKAVPPTHIGSLPSYDRPVDVYNLQGMLIRRNILPKQLAKELPAGMYIVSGRLTIIR